jgi:hypothetical protein
MWEPRRLTTLWAFTACYRVALPYNSCWFRAVFLNFFFERGTLTYGAATLRETWACTRSLPSAVVCELAELQSDRTLQLKHGELSLLKFWVLAEEEYP